MAAALAEPILAAVIANPAILKEVGGALRKSWTAVANFFNPEDGIIDGALYESVLANYEKTIMSGYLDGIKIPTLPNGITRGMAKSDVLAWWETVMGVKGVYTLYITSTRYYELVKSLTIFSVDGGTDLFAEGNPPEVVRWATAIRESGLFLHGFESVAKMLTDTWGFGATSTSPDPSMLKTSQKKTLKSIQTMVRAMSSPPTFIDTDSVSAVDFLTVPLCGAPASVVTAITVQVGGGNISAMSSGIFQPEMNTDAITFFKRMTGGEVGHLRGGDDNRGLLETRTAGNTSAFSIHGSLMTSNTDELIDPREGGIEGGTPSADAAVNDHPGIDVKRTLSRSNAKGMRSGDSATDYANSGFMLGAKSLLQGADDAKSLVTYYVDNSHMTAPAMPPDAIPGVVAGRVASPINGVYYLSDSAHYPKHVAGGSYVTLGDHNFCLGSGTGVTALSVPDIFAVDKPVARFDRTNLSVQWPASSGSDSTTLFSARVATEPRLRVDPQILAPAGGFVTLTEEPWFPELASSVEAYAIPVTFSSTDLTANQDFTVGGPPMRLKQVGVIKHVTHTEVRYGLESAYGMKYERGQYPALLLVCFPKKDCTVLPNFQNVRGSNVYSDVVTVPNSSGLLGLGLRAVEAPVLDRVGGTMTQVPSIIGYNVSGFDHAEKVWRTLDPSASALRSAVQFNIESTPGEEMGTLSSYFRSIAAPPEALAILAYMLQDLGYLQGRTKYHTFTALITDVVRTNEISEDDVQRITKVITHVAPAAIMATQRSTRTHAIDLF